MWIDLISSGMGACCFLFFVKGLLQTRQKKKWYGLFCFAVCFLLQFMIGNQWYGLLIMAALWLFLLALYQGKWQVKLFLAASYYAARELVRFTIYYIFTGVAGLLVEEEVAAFLQEQCTLEQFEEKMRVIEQGYAISFILAFNLLAFLFLFWYKKQLSGSLEDLGQSGAALLYLTVPALLGDVYCIILRSILFAWKEGEIWVLDKQFPIVRLLIPAGSILCLGAMLLSARLLGQMRKALKGQQETAIYQNRLKDMEGYIRDMERMYGDVRSMRHDLKNYVADMTLLAKGGGRMDQEAFGEYLKAVGDRVDALDFAYKTGNPITDVVVNRQLSLAAGQGICAESTFLFPADLGVEAFDISILLNNALENAIEACPAGGELVLSSKRQGSLFLLSVKNRCEGPVRWKDGMPVSTKKEGQHGMAHGQGIKNMQKIAEKYEGTVIAKMEGDDFLLEILLKGKAKGGCVR